MRGFQSADLKGKVQGGDYRTGQDVNRKITKIISQKRDFFQLGYLCDRSQFNLFVTGKINNSRIKFNEFSLKKASSIMLLVMNFLNIYRLS